MATAPLSAVLFDLDGTLYDRAASLRAFLSAQYGRRREILGALSREAFITTFVAYDANGSVRRDIVYPRILNEFGGDPAAAPLLVADYVDCYRDFCQESADLFPTLDRLRADGLSLGIVTNGQIVIQEHTLAGLGLDHAFDTILISEAEGIRKPDPEIFRRALARLDVTAGAAAYVGDNPEADIAGAHAAEMRAIWMANSYYRPPRDADATIHRLADLPAVVAAWR